MSLKLGYWVSIERIEPVEASKLMITAEKVGFEYGVTDDHFHPWTHTNAYATHPWIWIASLAAQTQELVLGTGVTAPIYRYHPAIVAQAFASLDALYPGRVFLAVGTGEAMNEVPLGFRWCPFGERADRLIEAVRIIRQLWDGGFVDFKGKYFELRKAKLYTLPKKRIPLIIAAAGPKMSKTAGRHGDGLMTSGATLEHYKDVVLKSFYEGAREAGKEPEKMPRFVEVKVAIDEDYDRAIREVRFWAATGIPGIFHSSVSDPRDLEEQGRKVSDETMRKIVTITTNYEDIIKVIEETIQVGFDHICINSCSPDEQKFIELLGSKIVPYMREQYGNEG